MAVAHVVLALLADGDRHGYDLKQQHDRRFPAARPLAFGQVYATLETLGRRGWVEVTGSEKAGAAERTSFHLTRDGRAELDRWLAEVEPPAPHAGSVFQVKVTLALLVAGPAAAEAYLRAQRSAHLARMRDYVQVTSDPDAAVTAVLAADYAPTHLEADLRWLAAAETRLGDLDRELGPAPVTAAEELSCTHARDVDPAEMRDPVLVARSVVKAYREPALRGVSMHVERGEVLVVSGPSGSGKSTLLLCLAGVLRPDAGEVRLRGSEGAADRIVSAESEAERSRLRRGRFGVVFQFGHLVPELTAAENVALPLLLGGARRGPALAVARDWLDRFDVAGSAGVRPSRLSGGEAQRVAVARAMVTEPEVLFADEPTGALDTVSGDRVLGQLVRVAREAATSVVLVTHDARVAAHGDREIVLRDGTVAGYELPVGA